MQIEKSIQNRIYEVRGERVMLDFDLAALYEVDTKRLNEQVKRNMERFPKDFMFRLTVEEWEGMWSHFATTSTDEAEVRSQNFTTSPQKRRKDNMPFACTEHGVTMLASVLKSGKAVQMSIAVVRVFIALKQFAMHSRIGFEGKLLELKQELTQRLDEHDSQLNSIYNALENLLDKETDKEAEKLKWENGRGSDLRNENIQGYLVTFPQHISIFIG